jgi:hypothetical protein
VGNAYAGWQVVLLIDGLDIQIFGFDGSQLRRLPLDPSGGTYHEPQLLFDSTTWPER